MNDTYSNINHDERQKVRRFFNRVAFVFPFIERSLFPEYRRALKKLNLPINLTVLDLATGTGILAGAFARRGHTATGLDFADKLLKRARHKFPQVDFRHFDLYQLDEIADGQYDIVTMGYFLHGVEPAFRHQVLTEAARIARQYVVVFDYCCDGNWLVRFIEWLEGPHYPSFVAGSREEDFHAAGLQIIKEINLSDFGSVWLCQNNTLRDTVKKHI